MRLVDTHCHLYDEQAFPDVDAVIDRAHTAGVERMIVIGIDLETSRKSIALAEKYESIFATVGCHPNHAAEYQPEHLREYEKLANHPKVLAIGEIGLDYHWDYATKEQQVRCLQDQVGLAQSLEMPVVWHCRDAYSDMLEFLESSRPAKHLFHCFGGNQADAERALALGAHFGFDGPITYPKAQETRDILAELPRDRVVIETDAPYMAPVPFRGKANEPSYLVHVNASISTVWGISEEACSEMTTRNAEAYFCLPPSS